LVTLAHVPKDTVPDRWSTRARCARKTEGIQIISETFQQAHPSSPSIQKTSLPVFGNSCLLAHHYYHTLAASLLPILFFSEPSTSDHEIRASSAKLTLYGLADYSLASYVADHALQHIIRWWRPTYNESNLTIAQAATSSRLLRHSCLRQHHFHLLCPNRCRCSENIFISLPSLFSHRALSHVPDFSYLFGS
jgi:hypothetical protein